MIKKKYGVNELRKMFLDFFESKDHLSMKSFSLVPHNDNSLLLINAGMAPLKPYFTGQEIPPRRRVCTCQKCIRTGDIDNVGKTARHGTFFEMLGNFSFGDYFKHEAIAWTWEFLTEVVGLEPDRLYPSVYKDDDEAFDIWNKEIGIAKDRIFRFGKEDNFWEHGSGPCGPCSEVYYDRGEQYGCGKPTCTVGCDCDRYMEVWNNVFTQFDNDGHGNYTELKNKNIDTGMGLERLAVVVQDVDSIFEVDTIRALLDHVARLAQIPYKQDEKKDISLRVITDHIRSCTFMISDGITPSNEGRGYVLRRLLRRAARHGRLLGIQGKFLGQLAETVIETSKDGYPELEEKKAMILTVLSSEEEKFNRTIDQGLQILSDLEDKMKADGKKELEGAEAFRLYDTYGFPLDLTKEILEEKGFGVDQEGFHVAAAPPVSGQAGIQSPVRVCPKDIRKSPAVIKSKGGVPVVFRHGRKPVLVHDLLAHGFTDRRGDQDMIGDAVFPVVRDQTEAPVHHITVFEAVRVKTPGEHARPAADPGLTAFHTHARSPDHAFKSLSQGLTHLYIAVHHLSGCQHQIQFID